MACDPNELMAEAACFACIQQNQRSLAIVALLCQISEASGGAEGGGGDSLLSGPDSPVGVVDAEGPALYVQDDGTLWTLPAGGDSGDWAPVAGMLPPPPVLQTEPEVFNRISTLERSLSEMSDHRNQESLILHEALLKVDQKVDQKADGVALEAAEEAAVALLTQERDRSTRLESELATLRSRLDDAVLKADLETVKVPILSELPQVVPIQVSVPMPAKKSPWWKRALSWTNLFA